MTERSDEYRKKNRERMAKKRTTVEGIEYTKKYVRTSRHRWNLCRKVAKEKELIFAISYEFYKEIILRPCYACQRSLKEEAGYSLDRIDNAKGYTEDNVNPCCGECNRRRHDSMGAEEFKKQTVQNKYALPNAGSIDAIMLGCICSVSENNFGETTPPVYEKKCKLHGHL